MRAFATKRIDEMAKRPVLFAVTCEGFLMQLWVLLEVAGVPVDDIRERLAIVMFGNNPEKGADRLSPEFSTKAIRAARELMEDYTFSDTPDGVPKA